MLTTAISTGCQLKGMELSDPDPKNITRRDLYRALNDHGKILVVYGFTDESILKDLTEIQQKLSANNRGIRLEFKASEEIEEEELTGTPVLLLGSPESNKWITQLAPRLPFRYDKGSFIVGDNEFSAADHVLMIHFYPNPLNPRLPINVITSQSDEELKLLLNKRLASVFWGGFNYEVIKNKQRVLLGDFDHTPENRWAYDPDAVLALPTQIVYEWQEGPFAYATFDRQLAPDSLIDFRKNTMQALNRIEQFVESGFDDLTIKHYLYPSTEVKGLMTGDTRQSHLEADSREVHTVYNEDYKHRHKGVENRFLLQAVLGKPAHEVWEQGLALFFTENWEQQGFNYWARRLMSSQNALTIDQLLDKQQSRYYSKLKREALSASLVAFLIDKLGKQEFLQRYRTWVPNTQEADELTLLWQDWVLQSPVNQPIATSSTSRQFLRGVNFTHEGYRIYNGYGSDLSAQSLEHLSEIHANAVAIVPYSGMRDPQSPQPLVFSESAGGEHDEGVIHTIKRAQTLGMVTMLKPQVWIRGSWPGAVDMSSQTQWDLFFEYYYQWISHYALMAEMHGVDYLCVGVEFSRATLSQPQKWRDLIKKLRGIYGGKLIYAANWGDEFEQITFWDELDYIGLNCYYPLVQDHSNKLLDKGVSKILKQVEEIGKRNHRKIILTEIGFRSVDSPWIQPHEEAGDKVYNEQHQALAYQSVFNQLSKYPQISGILWWKWPTVMRNRVEDRRFVPSGKAAEEVMRQNFEKMKAKR